MKAFVISGGNPLKGEVEVSGAKNVALKAIAAAFLTEDEVEIKNAPFIDDVMAMVEIARKLGADVEVKKDHRIIINSTKVRPVKIPLGMGAKLRASSVFLGSLVSRYKKAVVPNPGGCRIGARPIDRHIDGLRKIGIDVYYNGDGYFRAKADIIKGGEFRFEKNTHTGTETLILASVFCRGKVILENAAEEPEVDDLIRLVNLMGAKVKRTKARTIEIVGVDKLHGTSFEVMPDRNEVVTMAVGAIVTNGRVFVKGAREKDLKIFLRSLNRAGVGYEIKEKGIEFGKKEKESVKPTKVTTNCHPGFMTDWQAPWTLLMTEADGESIVHEAVYEKRFSYVEELAKMGAKISLFNPKVENPKEFYNFNWEDGEKYYHAAKVFGPTKLHNAVVEISDLRAGATLVLAALAAKGTSYLTGIEHIDRGYEDFEKRLRKLGAKIRRIDKEGEL